MLISESFATALLADAPPNHPTPRAEQTNAGASEMHNHSEAAMPLNTPDTTHRFLHERYRSAARKALALRELVRAGKDEQALGDVSPAPAKATNSMPV